MKKIGNMYAIPTSKFGYTCNFVTHPDLAFGERYRFMFQNNYQVSVIRLKNGYSYGSEEGLWEVAIMDKNHNLIVCQYNRHWGDTVLGYQNGWQVRKLLKEVESLPKRR